MPVSSSTFIDCITCFSCGSDISFGINLRNELDKIPEDNIEERVKVFEKYNMGKNGRLCCKMNILGDVCLKDMIHKFD